MMGSPTHVSAISTNVSHDNAEIEAAIIDRYNAIDPLIYTDHKGQIDNILNALQKGHSPLITGKDGRNTIELITAIYYAANFNTTVALPINSSHPFYTFEGIVSQMNHFHVKKLNP